MAYPSVQTIQSAFINSRCSEVDLATAKHIRKLMEEARGGRGVEDALEEISKLIGGFGHEVINGGDNRGGFWQNAVLAYVNMGDTYDATIYYDTDKGTFGVGAWGGWVEAYERHGGQLQGVGRRRGSFMRVPRPLGGLSPLAGLPFLAAGQRVRVRDENQVATVVRSDRRGTVVRFDDGREDTLPRNWVRELDTEQRQRQLQIKQKLASSGSLNETGIKKLIAEYYYSRPERITLIDQGTHWQVKNGEKLVSPVVVKQGKRYVFGIMA